jgi:hypothetical protein
MPEAIKRNFALQLVGLGGTGTDVIASLMKNKSQLIPLLKTEGLRLSCMALDVADDAIPDLMEAYKQAREDLKTRGIPGEKLFLVANSVKFPNPGVMFDFVREYLSYLKHENAILPSDYKPWLTATIQIPPLAGGVGRQRALAKAIYGLNYHVLQLIRDSISAFKEHVVSSTLQPIVFVIYGMGGGSGSGMVLDFTRHLRKEMGTGIPIIGIGILPCSGDDPPAKGASAFSALMEHGMVIDRGINNAIIQKFSPVYETPFNGFFVVPLSPAFGQGKGRLFAHESIDYAIGDILVNCFNFDLADLLVHVGCNVDLEGKWLHTLSTISVAYPVQEYIDLTKNYLDRLDKIRVLRKEKKEIYGGTSITDTGGIKGLLQTCHAELSDIYSRYLIARGKYDPAKFTDTIRNLIYDDRSIDTDFIMHLRGAHESIQSQLEELYHTVKAVGLDAPEGTLEARIRKLLLQIYNTISDLPQKPQEFESKIPEILIGLPEDLLNAHQLAPRQVQLVRDVIDLAGLIQDFVTALKSYLEIRKFADKLYRLIEASEISESREVNLAAIRKLVNPELVVLSSLISSLISPLSIEIRNLDEHLTNCRRMKKLLNEDEHKYESQCQGVEERKLTLQAEKKRLESDMQRVRPIFTAPGKKRFIETKLREVTQNLQLLDQELDVYKASLLKVREKLREYSDIEKKYDVNSGYRSLIPEIIAITKEYQDKMSELTTDRGFYERTGELTENEQLKIMQRILRGDERALNRENILNEIVDRDHLNRYLASVLNLFRLPDTMGLNSGYRTDFLWLTIVAPHGIWNEELERDVTTALAGYVKEDVSRTLYVRQIESDDPWKVRFLLVAAKAKPSWLNNFQDMKQHYDSRTVIEKQLAHSFLLEYGLQSETDDPAQIIRIIKDINTTRPDSA